MEVAVEGLLGVSEADVLMQRKFQNQKPKKSENIILSALVPTIVTSRINATIRTASSQHPSLPSTLSISPIPTHPNFPHNHAHLKSLAIPLFFHRIPKTQSKIFCTFFPRKRSAKCSKISFSNSEPSTGQQ